VKNAQPKLSAFFTDNMSELPGPYYVAIITDGNGRWAKQRGLPLVSGHEAGANNIKARLRDAAQLGIKELTIWAFSTENWARPKTEVDQLMAMFARRIDAETPELHREGVRMRFIGRRCGVDPKLVERMEWAEQTTADNRLITLFIAFNYGGRSEIIDAASKFTGGDEEEFRRHLYAPEMHDPDLVIRTGGDHRISNYLIWQTVYSEYVFCDEPWPDFSREDLEQSLAEFHRRKRRFGGRPDDESADKP
jgi:undecaprenyl diphosphate synthase